MVELFSCILYNRIKHWNGWVISSSFLLLFVYQPELYYFVYQIFLLFLLLIYVFIFQLVFNFFLWVGLNAQFLEVILMIRDPFLSRSLVLILLSVKAVYLTSSKVAYVAVYGLFRLFWRKENFFNFGLKESIGAKWKWYCTLTHLNVPLYHIYIGTIINKSQED